MKRIGIAAGAVACASLLVLTACTARDGGSTENGSGGELTVVDAQPAGTQPVDEVTWAIVEGEPT